MRRLLLAIPLLASLGCTDQGPKLPAAGEACDAEGQCAEGLDCVHLVCADDRGPQITIHLPESMTIYGTDESMLAVHASVFESADGDRVEFIVDPAADAPHRETIAIDGDSASTVLMLPDPLAVGPHHLSARVVDADGVPYPNPSASNEVVTWVPDPDIPDTPQIAIVWPPHDYQHRLGNPLEIELVVLQDSFTFVEDGPECLPLPNCEPEFAPECEAECGPVERSGHAKLYTLPDYPNCLLDEPISCNGEYIWSLRNPEQLEDFRVREVLPGDVNFELGGTPLHAALSSGYHMPYPSAANVIRDTITLQVIE
jgi:hypothetical protein